jgi:hypothetical protein
VQLLVEAFEAVLLALGVVERDDPLATIAAKHLVETGKQGERDPGKLVDCTLAAVAMERSNGGAGAP